MPRLFDISKDFEELFNQFDAINKYEFEKNENGDYVDDDGNVIIPEVARQEMLEAWFDTLEGIEEEFNFKAENVAQYIKTLNAESTEIKAEEDKLRKRRQQKEKKSDTLKNYLKSCMEQIGVKKVETPRAKLTIRNNAPALKIEDEVEFVTMLQNQNKDELLKYSLPELKKAEIKKLIKSGSKFDGATLESSQSLIIS